MRVGSKVHVQSDTNPSCSGAALTRMSRWVVTQITEEFLMGQDTDIGNSLHQPERRHRRFALRYPVVVKFESGNSSSELQAVSKNVSIGDLLLEAGAPLPQDCPISFTLTVKGKPEARPIQLAGHGKVVRVETPGGDGMFAIAVECSHPISEMEFLAAS